MNKIENGEIVKNIFLDFQIYGYRSVVVDLFFFLWTSVQKKVLEEHLDHLLVHYHSNLLATLNSFKMDTTEFGYDAFEEEIRLETEFEFGHTLLFMFILKHVNFGAILRTFSGSVDNLTPEFRENVHFMVAECIKRGWV